MAGPHRRPQDRRSGSIGSGEVWVEGQITQVSRRPGTGTAFLVLRDPDADMSLSLTCPPRLVRDRHRRSPRAAGSWCTASPSFYLERGTLSLRVDEVRAGRGRRAAGPHRAAAAAARRRRAVRPPTQAPAAVPARLRRADHRPGQRRRARRRRATPPPAGPRCSSGSRNIAMQGAARGRRRSSTALEALDRTPRSTSSSWPAAAAASRTCCRSPTRRCAGRCRACRDPGGHGDRARAGHPAASTTSPTCALDPDRRRPSASCPTSPRRPPTWISCATAATAPCTAGCDRERRLLDAVRSRPVRGRSEPPAARARPDRG